MYRLHTFSYTGHDRPPLFVEGTVLNSGLRKEFWGCPTVAPLDAPRCIASGAAMSIGDDDPFICSTRCFRGGE